MKMEPHKKIFNLKKKGGLKNGDFYGGSQLTGDKLGRSGKKMDCPGQGAICYMGSDVVQSKRRGPILRVECPECEGFRGDIRATSGDVGVDIGS
jgi:hypothetical protein